MPADATAIAGDELSLVYSYSADDLRGRTLMGNVDVVASVDGVAITPTVGYVDGVIGEITIILSRAEYPEPDEHELAVTLSLSATATGFALGKPSSIRTPFSFGTPAVADTVVHLLSGQPKSMTCVAARLMGNVMLGGFGRWCCHHPNRRLCRWSHMKSPSPTGGISIEPDEHELAVTLQPQRHGRAWRSAS